MKNKTFVGIIGALIIVVAGYFILGGSFDFNITKDAKDKTKSKATSTTYINEAGKEFTVPHGKYEFQVSSADQEGPTFLEGEIDPPDVHLGDIQKFRVVVTSEAGIDSVVANIETDNGTTTVPLERTGTLDSSQLSVPRLKVNANQVVEVLTENERNQIAKDMQKGYIPTVYAQEGENEIWEGEWKVKDVHDTTYITEFVAVDNNGETEDLVLAWSDKCSIPIKGDWSYFGSCTHSSGIDGVARSGYQTSDGDADYAGGTLSISGGTFVIEGSFNLNGGEISLGGGTLDLSSTLYIDDYDGDGYPDPSFSQYISNASDRNHRAAMSEWTEDCNRWTSDVYPNNPNWYTDQIDYCAIDVCYVDQGWDYNCSGAKERFQTHRSACQQLVESDSKEEIFGQILSKFKSQEAFATDNYNGWVGSVPDCGQSSLWNSEWNQCGSQFQDTQQCH